MILEFISLSKHTNRTVGIAPHSGFVIVYLLTYEPLAKILGL